MNAPKWLIFPPHRESWRLIVMTAGKKDKEKIMAAIVIIIVLITFIFLYYTNREHNSTNRNKSELSKGDHYEAKLNFKASEEQLSVKPIIHSDLIIKIDCNKNSEMGDFDNLKYVIIKTKNLANYNIYEYDLRYELIDPRSDMIELQSHSDKSLTYKVSLKGQTCTCEDFIKRRAGFQINYWGRWCKHLIGAIIKNNLIGIPNEIQKIILMGYGGGPTRAWKVPLKTARYVIAMENINSEWINVHAMSKRSGEKISESSGEIKQYGWNCHEKRWSYGEGPPGSRELAPILRDVFCVDK